MFDAVMPADMAARAEESGIKRAELDPLTLLVLAVLGGAFVAFGAVFATTVTAGSAAITSADGGALSAGLPYGIVRLLTGVTFCLGLVLVVVGGAELFTGNVLIVMAWASRKVTTRAVLQNWTLAFIGNFVGAIATAALVFFSTQYTFGGGSVGLVALNTAHAKTSLAFFPALTLAILCNTLVCLAVWMCYGARTTIDRVVTVVPPIAGFAAAGFEHSIANIYFIPLGLFIKAGARIRSGLRLARPLPISQTSRGGISAQTSCRSRSATLSAALSWSARSTGSSTCASGRRRVEKTRHEAQSDQIENYSSA